MPGDNIHLLALDGGGVRGLSCLMILRRLMATVDPDSPPKPCDYFDMIGGTSTGGLIAVMLGRLRMSVDECIEAYTSLSDKVFEKKCHRVTIKGKLQGRFDSAELERAIKQIVQQRGQAEDALLKDLQAPCKVFVCATNKDDLDTTVCLTSYRSPRDDSSDLLDSTAIWQACRATSAATTFFDPIAIGPYGEEFVDGALGANNPVYEVWGQAVDMWGADTLERKLRCFVSIGTGVPGLKKVRDDLLGITATLSDLATETEKTARRFHRDNFRLDDEGRYYRFNVDRGLEEIGLEESKRKKEIATATRSYVQTQTVFKQITACAGILAGREYSGPYRTMFSLQGIPRSQEFVERPSDTAAIESCLLPRRRSEPTRQRVFVLRGLGGIGKTQLAVDFARRHKTTFSSIFWLDGRSENQLRQSIAACARRIPEGQISDRSRSIVPSTEADPGAIVADVLEWLAHEENIGWLLVFDNVDQDIEQGGKAGAYDVQKYLDLVGDHGAVLITTRLPRLSQLGESKHLQKVDREMARTIFQKWRGEELELLELLDGLPLALAQAASYLRETHLDTASYVQIYKESWGDLMRSDDVHRPPLVDYEKSVGTTWTISLKAVEKEDKSAANLICMWAFLGNKDLSHRFIRVAADEDVFPAWLCDLASNRTRFLGAARVLLRYSMIGSMAEAQEPAQERYMIHPVVHRWAGHVQSDCDKRALWRLAMIMVGLLEHSCEDSEYWDWLPLLFPHAERCFWWMGKIDISSGAGQRSHDVQLSKSMQILGDMHWYRGRSDESRLLYERALSIAQQAYGLDGVPTLPLLQRLANIHQEKDRFDEAEDAYVRTLQCSERALGLVHNMTLSLVRDLGILYLRQNRLDEAESLFERSLQCAEEMLGQGDIKTLDAIGCLAMVLQRKRRFAEAEVMLEHQLRGYENLHGSEQPPTLVVIASLAELYTDKGDLLRAEAMYQRALEGFGKTLGLSSLRALSAVVGLAYIYFRKGDMSGSDAMYQRALQGLRNTLGSSHPEYKKVLQEAQYVEAVRESQAGTMPFLDQNPGQTI
ncbi:hypothetical protein RB593_001686 [Gaeumannomyces tritici]